MDEILVSAADYVVVGDGYGVNAAPGGLEDVDALERADVPNLRERRERKGKKYIVAQFTALCVAFLKHISVYVCECIHLNVLRPCV